MSIGTEKFTIVVTPNLETTVLNIQTTATIQLYFNLLFVIEEKYCAVEEVKPTAVVKQANVTIIANTTCPI